MIFFKLLRITFVQLQLVRLFCVKLFSHPETLLLFKLSFSFFFLHPLFFENSPNFLGIHSAISFLNFLIKCNCFFVFNEFSVSICDYLKGKKVQIRGKNIYYHFTKEINPFTTNNYTIHLWFYKKKIYIIIIIMIKQIKF